MSNIDSKIDDDEVSLLDVLYLLTLHLRLLFFTPLLVFFITLSLALIIPPSYSASVRFLPPQQQQSSAVSMLANLGSLGGLAGGALGNIKNPSDQYISFLKSNSIQDQMIERFHLAQRYETSFKVDTRTALFAHVRFSAAKDGIITIEVDDRSAQTAADMANAYVEELQKLLSRLAVTEAQQKRVFFEKQWMQTKDRLVSAEIALKSTGINSNVLKSSPQLAVEYVAKLKAAVTAQEIKTASLRGYLSESAYEFKQAMAELGVLRQQLSRLDQQEQNTTASASDYVSKFREYKYQETLFELFSKQYELARLDESREGAVIQVLDLAQVPEKPSSPQKIKIAVTAALITLLALIVGCFLNEVLKRSKQNGVTQGKWLLVQDAFRQTLGVKRILK